MADHRIPYVATASIGFPNDLIMKVKKAKEMPGGFRYIHVQGPCAPGWRIAENKVVEIARLAVECGIWLLYEVEDGQTKITHKPTTRKTVKEYLLKQGRFSHLTEEDFRTIQTLVDRQCESYNF